jgi:hypothetical protein
MPTPARELVTELQAELGFTFYPTSITLTSPSGRAVQLLQFTSSDLVDCNSYHNTQDTIARIISEAMYAGLPAPSQPEACAAAFSVPDGAPLAQALDNLGCSLSETAAAQMQAWARQHRALRQKFG